MSWFFLFFFEKRLKKERVWRKTNKILAFFLELSEIMFIFALNMTSHASHRNSAPGEVFEFLNLMLWLHSTTIQKKFLMRNHRFPLRNKYRNWSQKASSSTMKNWLQGTFRTHQVYPRYRKSWQWFPCKPSGSYLPRWSVAVSERYGIPRQLEAPRCLEIDRTYSTYSLIHFGHLGF